MHWEARLTGTIRTLRVDKGFGFIKDDTGKEYFFHRSAVYGEGLDNLREGDSVAFDVGKGQKVPGPRMCGARPPDRRESVLCDAAGIFDFRLVNRNILADISFRDYRPA